MKKINDDVAQVVKDMKNTQLLNNNDRNVLKFQKEKLTDLEDRSRRNNLRIDGLKENEKETWLITEEKVKELFKTRLQVEGDIDINGAHRVGKKESGKPRTIVLHFQKYKDKERIKQNARKLKYSGIYINGDFSFETLQIQKDLLKTARELRDKGKGAKVVKDKLTTWDIVRNEEASNGEH